MDSLFSYTPREKGSKKNLLTLWATVTKIVKYKVEQLTAGSLFQFIYFKNFIHVYYIYTSCLFFFQLSLHASHIPQIHDIFSLIIII